MKAMDKVRRGKSFKGVVIYALRPEKKHKTVPEVIGGNMAGTTAEKLIREFNRTKVLRPDVAKAVWHNSLRLPYGDTLTNEQWSEIADDYMSRMGFSYTHLHCYILHDDNEGQHIHIIASRIDLDGGKLYLGKNENLISTRITQDLERDYNLTRTQGPKISMRPSPPGPKKLSRNEAKMEERQGEQSPKSVIQEALEALLTSGKPDAIEFIQQLAAENIRVIPNIASTGRMNGFSFEYAGIAFKASQLGKSYSWSKLKNKINYQPERDNAYLLTLKCPAVSEANAIVEENVASPASAIPDNDPFTIEVTLAEQTTGPVSEVPVRKITLGEMLAQFTNDLETTTRKKLNDINFKVPASAEEYSASADPGIPSADSFADLAATPDLSAPNSAASASRQKKPTHEPAGANDSKMSIGEMLAYLDEKREAKIRLENVVNQERKSESVHQSRHFLQGRWLPYIQKILHMLKGHGLSLIHAAKPFEQLYRATSLEERNSFGSTAELERQQPVMGSAYLGYEPPSKGRIHGSFK